MKIFKLTSNVNCVVYARCLTFAAASIWGARFFGVDGIVKIERVEKAPSKAVVHATRAPKDPDRTKEYRERKRSYEQAKFRLFLDDKGRNGEEIVSAGGRKPRPLSDLAREALIKEIASFEARQRNRP